jgi:hypothetical protein
VSLPVVVDDDALRCVEGGWFAIDAVLVNPTGIARTPARYPRIFCLASEAIFLFAASSALAASAKLSRCRPYRSVEEKRGLATQRGVVVTWSKPSTCKGREATRMGRIDATQVSIAPQS